MFPSMSAGNAVDLCDIIAAMLAKPSKSSRASCIVQSPLAAHLMDSRQSSWTACHHAGSQAGCQGLTGAFYFPAVTTGFMLLTSSSISARWGTVAKRLPAMSSTVLGTQGCIFLLQGGWTSVHKRRVCLVAHRICLAQGCPDTAGELGAQSS